MSGFTKTDTIWFNGKLVPWDQAQVHVLAHCLHYGTGVFEGLRSYETPEGAAIFRLDAHLRRFFQSAAMYDLEIPYSYETLYDASLDLVRQNRLGNAYLRPIAFFDAHTLTVWPEGCPVSVAIAGMPRGAYLAEALQKGARVTISPIRKFDSAAIPSTGKACGQYINSVRAAQDAIKRGFDEALLLNSRGEVAEGSGENLFLVRQGTLITNDADASILMGITRDSILTIARDLGLPTRVEPITLAALSAADELFFCGTAVEVTPIREVDGRPISGGRPGPITTRIQQTFFEMVQGRRAEYKHWLAYAGAPIGVRS
jgi:branched-chain amino acid aminotransferase